METAINLKFINLKKFIALAMSFIIIFSVFIANSSVIFAASVQKPKISSVTAKNATTVTIKWGKVSGANGYAIYQKKADGEYKKIATVKSGSKVSYTKKSLSSATKYSYKIKAYKVVKGKTTYSSYSYAKSTYTKPVNPTITSAKAVSTSSIKISWKKISKAAGYVVYQKNGSSYKKIATIKSSKTTSYTVKGLKSNKKYSFAVCSYYKPTSKTVYSVKSAAKSATTQKAKASSAAKVWIPTMGGKKYHSNSGCSNMKNPDYVTKSEALSLGFDACKRCYK